MIARIGSRLLAGLQPSDKPYQVHDEDLRRFFVRVQPSGLVTYCVNVRLTNERLRDQLDLREDELRRRRQNHNEWLKERNYSPLAEIQKHEFADYLKPMVLLSINTGLRRGEMFNLSWHDIDFRRRFLRVNADGTKSAKHAILLSMMRRLKPFEPGRGNRKREMTLSFPAKMESASTI